MNTKLFCGVTTLALLMSPLIGGVSQAASVTTSIPRNPSTIQGPIVGTMPSSPPKSFPLTLGQLRQTITTVNQKLGQSSTGMVSVSPLVLRQAGLTGSEIGWAEHAMAVYDHNIKTGMIHPVLRGGSIPYSLSSTASMATISPLSTYGMPYYWYIARTPYWLTQYFWWGYSRMGNNNATKNLVKVLSGVAGGASIAGLFTWEYAWIVGLSGLVIGAYANRINNTNAQGGFFGVHLNFVLGNPIPVGVYANQP